MGAGMNTKINSTVEAWESRQLGADRDSVRPVASALTDQIEDSLGLQAISIRLDKSLIESFKLLAEYHGVGYQPLMRDALKRFADCELKNIARGVIEAQRKNTPAQHEPTEKHTGKGRKAA
jgi:uncharacterized protein (DUF4415 family)